jgi:ABC-2 type transport system permease protein
MFTGVGILIGLLFTGRLTGFQLQYLPFMAVIVFFGILINSLIRIGISILSFWIEDSGPFHWIFDKLIIVLGTLFPIEIFPLWIQPLIKVTPIFVITYGPAKLIIDFSMDMFLNVLLVQLAYLAVTVLILTILFRRGVAKLNVNGG